MSEFNRSRISPKRENWPVAVIVRAETENLIDSDWR